MERIEHVGVIEEISTKRLVVNILQQTSCLSCSVKGACNSAESESKLIEVFDYEGHYTQGERVTVFFENAMGFKALFLAYIFPFLVLMVVLIGSANWLENETHAGLLALGSLAPTYGLIYLFRERIGREFRFRIEKKAAEPVQFNRVTVNPTHS
jgi:sigma-E factor negative regulatory protein RseC